MMPLHAHPKVSDEIDRIADRFAAVRPRYGLRFLTALHAAYESIQSAPASFPKWPYPVRGHELRFTVLRRFKHVIVFEVRPTEVYIVSVYHGRRHHRHWLNRLVNDSA